MKLDAMERLALEMIRDWEKERYWAELDDYADRENDRVRLARFVMDGARLKVAVDSLRRALDGESGR